MSGWNKEKIANSQRDANASWVSSADRNSLIERIIALETALYPFAYVFGSLDSKSWRGTTATSKLFPLYSEGDKLLVYRDGKSVEIDTPSEEEWHKISFYESDSLTIEDGSKIHSNFELFSVHQQAPGAYVGCGAISMGDVRDAVEVLRPQVTTERLPDPALVEKIARILCKQSGHDPDGGPKYGYGWINHQKDALEIISAFSAT